MQRLLGTHHLFFSRVQVEKVFWMIESKDNQYRIGHGKSILMLGWWALILKGPCTLLIVMIKLSLIGKWSHLSWKGNNARSLEENTSIFLLNPIRIVAWKMNRRSFLTASQVPLHKFGGLRFLRGMMGILTFSWSLWNETPDSSLEYWTA